MLERGNVRIKIGCAFFVPFFAQAKKGNTYANKRKEGVLSRAKKIK
jgi:hypothetical protein